MQILAKSNWCLNPGNLPPTLHEVSIGDMTFCVDLDISFIS